MSIEELKNRGELEMDVERDLEEEIKDGIYHLALKLHQLKKPKHFYQNNTREYKSEVNINIRVEGGTIVQVNEIKKEGSRINRPTLTSATKSQPNVGGHYAGSSTSHHGIKFNWEKSLREESNMSILFEKIPPKKPVGYVHSSAKHGCAGKSMKLGLKNEVRKWKY